MSQIEIKKSENTYSRTLSTDKATNKSDNQNIQTTQEIINLNKPEISLHQFIKKKTLRGRKEKISLPKNNLKCEICLKYFKENSFESLIKCLKCGCICHPQCNKTISLNYQIPFLCERCTHAAEINEPIDEFKCFICNNTDGILNYNQFTKSFYHQICVDLIPEFKNVDLSNIKKENLRRWRYKNSCKYCGKKLSKNEVVIKCKNTKCREFFHIPCAIEKGLIFDMNFMKNFYDVDNNADIPFYCSNHNKKITNAYKNYVTKGICSFNNKNSKKSKSNEKTSFNSMIKEITITSFDEKLKKNFNEENSDSISVNDNMNNIYNLAENKNKFIDNMIHLPEINDNIFNLNMNGIDKIENENDYSYINSLVNDNYCCIATDDFFEEIPLIL